MKRIIVDFLALWVLIAIGFMLLCLLSCTFVVIEQPREKEPYFYELIPETPKEFF